MATYKDVIAYIRQKHGFAAQTCWIAHVLEEHGSTRGPAVNRKQGERVKPCPPHRRAQIESALVALGRLPG